MKVLMVIAEMGTGGAEAIVETLARRLVAGGDRVVVASAGGRRLASLAEAGVRSVETPMRERSRARTLLAAKTLLPLRRTPPDVIHAHNVRAAVTAHAGLRWPGRKPPLVTTVHGLVPEDYGPAARLLARTTDVVVAVSEVVAEQLREAGFTGRVEVVENAVHDPVPAERDAVRSELGIAPGAPVVLTAARLAPPKRPDLLVGAFAALPRDAVLLVAGGGPLLDGLRPLAMHLGVEDRVRLLGERTDVGRLLGAADVFCLASDSEGMPVSVLEAMAAGVPVVASDVGGIARGSDGAVRLVPPGSPSALGNALASLIADPAARRSLARRGREVVAARYAPEAMVERYRALYASAAPR